MIGKFELTASNVYATTLPSKGARWLTCSNMVATCDAMCLPGTKWKGAVATAFFIYIDRGKISFSRI